MLGCASSKLNNPPAAHTRDSRPPEELTRIYLAFLHKHIMKVLVDRLSEAVVRETPIEFVITVPAIWTAAAKQKMRVAAEKAGFRAPGGGPLYMVSEPARSPHPPSPFPFFGLFLSKRGPHFRLIPHAV